MHNDPPADPANDLPDDNQADTPDDPTTTDDDFTTIRVTSEVASFYPMLGGWGWFGRIGRVHVNLDVLAG